MNKAIIISKKAAARMDYNMEWDMKVAPSMGLRNPWPHRPDRLLNTEEIIAKIEGVEVPATKSVYRKAEDDELQAWREERDKYIELRNGYVCEQMLKDFGYETFVEECHFQNRDDLLDVFLPCESIDSQCNMFCPIWDTCAIRKCEKEMN